MKKFSVIVPCYNCTPYIDICLNHLLNQSIGLDNLEIILVDDCSTDNGCTLNMLKEYESTYPENIILIPLQKNIRQGGARNIGIKYASGQYIAFCDSDDTLHPRALETLYQIASKYSADSVEFDLTDIYSPESFKEFDNLNIDEVKPYSINILTDNDRKQNIFRENSTLCHCTKIYRREFVIENNILYPENITTEEPPFTLMVRFLEKNTYELIHLYTAIIITATALYRIIIITKDLITLSRIAFYLMN